MKRVNSLSTLCGTLHEQGVRVPCTEEQLYQFLKSEVNLETPASQLKAYFESSVFSRYFVGVESLQSIVSSHRCLGAALKTALTCPRYTRARWSDSQHAEGLLQDRDAEGIIKFLEVKSAVHKTARALHLRRMFLPVASPAFGVTAHCWGNIGCTLGACLVSRTCPHFHSCLHLTAIGNLLNVQCPPQRPKVGYSFCWMMG